MAEVYTVAQFARKTGRSETAIRMLIMRGKIEVLRNEIDRRVLIPASELAKFDYRRAEKPVGGPCNSATSAQSIGARATG